MPVLLDLGAYLVAEARRESLTFQTDSPQLCGRPPFHSEHVDTERLKRPSLSSDAVPQMPQVSQLLRLGLFLAPEKFSLGFAKHSAMT